MGGPIQNQPQIYTLYCGYLLGTLQGMITYPTLGKRKLIVLKLPVSNGIYVIVSQEGTNILLQLGFFSEKKPN